MRGRDDGGDSAETRGAAEPGDGAVPKADVAGEVFGGAWPVAAARGVAAGVQAEEPVGGGDARYVS